MATQSDTEWRAEHDRLTQALDNVYEVYYYVRINNPGLYEAMKDDFDAQFRANRDRAISALFHHNDDSEYQNAS